MISIQPNLKLKRICIIYIITSLSETGHNDPESDKTVIVMKHFFVFVLGHCYMTEAAVCATDL